VRKFTAPNTQLLENRVGSKINIRLDVRSRDYLELETVLSIFQSWYMEKSRKESGSNISKE
jgi:hypothetical protein